MRTAWPIALLTVACARETPASDPAPATTTVAGESVTALGQLTGRWEIARFGDFAPSWRTHDGWRSTWVDVDRDWLGYSIGCNSSGNRAAIDAKGTLHDLSGDRITTLAGCDAWRQTMEHTFYAFFGTRPKVMRQADGTVTLDNGQTQLVLERPEAARLRLAPKLDEIAGRWVPHRWSRLSGSGSSSGGFEIDPGVVTIGRDTLAWSGCPAASVRTRYTARMRFERLAGPQGDCRRGERPGGDGAVRLMRLMRSNPAVLREAPAQIVLFTDDEAIHLQSEHIVLHPPAPPPMPPGNQVSPPPPPPPPTRPTGAQPRFTHGGAAQRPGGR